MLCVNNNEFTLHRDIIRGYSGVYTHALLKGGDLISSQSIIRASGVTC